MPSVKACVLPLLALLMSSAQQAEAGDVVVRTFANGNGQGDAGIVESGEDTEIDGPQALTTDDNGNIYLLDQVNNRVLRFDPKSAGSEPTVLKLPDDLRPTDLIVRKDDIIVWDGTVRSLRSTTAPEDSSTRGLEEVSTRAGDDQTVTSAFAQMGSEDPGDAGDLLDPNTRVASVRGQRARARQHIASRGAGLVTADIIPDENDAGARIEVSHENNDASPFARLHIKVRNRLGAVEFLEVDRNGRMYVFAENLPTSSGRAGAFVVRYASGGALEGVYELPLSDVPLSRRFVTVSSDGDVYFLRTQAKDVEVLGVGFRALGHDDVIDVQTSMQSTPGKKSTPGLAAAVRPLTRQRVIETAFAFEGVQWKVNPAAYGHDPDTACTGFAGRIRRPGYLHGKLGQEVRGVPYCWGCFGSLDQIRTKIERGVLAGNICTNNTPRSDATGVDCSAFVSATWGLATHFTTTAIPSIASRISPSDLRPGDALDRPGSHVMLFLRFTVDRKAEVMESSTGGCNGRVCRNIYPLASLVARGYEPVRFRALANDNSMVEQIAPVGGNEKPEKPDHPRRRAQRRRG
jgi:hypothetical protein